MAVGRITGPLLAKNLLRDGVDIAFETDLLYLDVTTGRIGIKTANPQYTLDVQGDTNVLALRVETTSTLGNLTISSTSASTILSNSLGDVQIQTPVDNKILLKNSTIVSGNLHATGDITADGSVQLGNNTGTDTLSIYADIVSNITPQTPNNYDLGAPGKEWAAGYIDTLVASALVGKAGGDVNISPALGQTTNINSNVRIWGDNPLGTGPVTDNVLYVTMDGSDTNDGRAMDPSRACRTITGAIRSPFYKEGTSIKVAPGRYFEDNPIRMKRLTSIIGSDLRTTFIEPINKTQDLFWVNSGCYLAQMQFSNGQSGLLPGTGYTAGTNRGAYATAFPPNYGEAKIDLFYSPYIQNCTNQSGPWLMDGTMFIPNQTVQIPSGVGTATWVTNTTTMIVHIEEGTVSVGDTINVGPQKQGYINARTLLLANKSFLQEQVIAYIDEKYQYFGYDQAKCERDTSLIIDSLVSDLVFSANGYTQSNFAGLQYWSQNGYTGSIASEISTTTAAINYVSSIAQKIVQNITTGTRYQSTVTQATGIAATSVEATAIATDFGVITSILTNGTVGVTDIIIPNGTNVVSTASQHAVNLLQTNKAYLEAEAIAYINQNNVGFSYDQGKCARDVGYMVDSICFDMLYGGNRQAIQSGVYYYGFSDTSSVIANERPQTTAAYHRIREIADNLVTNTAISKSPGNQSVQVVSLPSATSAEATSIKVMVDLITEIISAGPAAALTPTPVSLTKTANANILKAAEILKANKAFIIDEIIGYVDYTYNNGFAYNQPKCYRDTGLIVESIASDLLYNGDTQSTFAGLQYWNQTGYTGLIETEITATVAAINYVSSLAQQVITNATGTRYQSTLTQSVGFIYNQEKCARDTGLIVDAIAQDILFGGTTQSTFAGVQYWNHDGYVGAIQGELTTTTNAINYVKDLAQKIITNDVTGTRYQFTVTQTTNLIAGTASEQASVAADFDVILNILADGVAGVTDIIVPNSLDASLVVNVQNAYALLQANKAYIQTEAVAYVQNTKTFDFTYDQAKCYRDVGYMLDSISFDLLYGGNLQAIESGVYYYGYNAGSTALPGEQTQSVGAYNYLRSILPYIIAGTQIVAPKQSQVAQSFVGGNGGTTEIQLAQSSIDVITNIITNGPSVASAPQSINQTATDNPTLINAATRLHANRNFIKAEVVAYVNRTFGAGSITEIEKVASEFAIITNILTTGTAGVTDIIESNGSVSTTTSVIDAYNLLQTNKAYIQAEAVAFVNSTYKIFDQAKCARDTGLIIDAIAQDLLFTTSSQSTFAGLQYWNQSGYTGIINTEITTTTNAINWIKSIAQKVIVNDVSGVRHAGGQITYLPPATGAEVTTIGTDFDVITNILTTGTAHVTDIIVPNSLTASTDANVLHAYDLLQANKTYLENEAVAFVEATKSFGYVYDPVRCARDIGFIIDSISFDLLYGGNRQAVQSGVYYYGFSGSSSAIPGESANTIAAYTKLKELLPYIVQGISYPSPSQTGVVQVVAGGVGTSVQASTAQASVDIITNIIQTGPSAAATKSPIRLTASANTSTVNSAKLIENNREFLVAEVLAYISDPTGFNYDQSKCYRDVGYMIDSVCFDLLHGGNRQAVQSGVYYYTFDANSTAIPNEIPQTTAAYNHIRNIVGKIVTKQTVVPSSGNTATQVLIGSTTTNVVIADIYDKIDTITNIINNGPSVAATKQPIGLTATTDTDKLAAYELLLANKSFIQAETVAFTNLFDTGFVYNRAKCARDIGIVLENISYDVAFGGNEKSREAGLAYWNGVTSYIPNEITETSDAFIYLASLAKDIVANTTTTNLLNDFQTAPQVINTVLTDGEVAQEVIDKLINIINTIITTGPASAPDIQVGNGPDWGSVSAEVLLQSNRSFIQNEVLNWINTTYPDFSYKEDKCYRDTGLIVDAISQDIILNANAKTVEAAVTYWTGNKNVLENATYGNKNQVVETVAAINHAKAISLQIINNTTVTSSGFVFNPTKCSRDTGLIVDALAQDLLFGGSSQSTFAGIQYWNHGEYVGDIANQLTTTTAALNYISQLAQKIVQNITTGTRYQSTLTQDTSLPAATLNEATAVAKNFSTVTNILTNGVVGITDKIVPNGFTPSADLNIIKAYDLLQANVEYLKAEAIGFVDATKNFRYDAVKCARDSGLIVDSIVMDLLYPTEDYSQSTFAGLQYWNQNGYTGNILNERDMTISAINYASQLAQRVVQNDVSGPRYQNALAQDVSLPAATAAEATTIATEFGLITGILTTGTANVTNLIVSNGVSALASDDISHAYDLLQANKAYIQAEVVAFVETTKNFAFVYDQSLCYRDVGYMVDSVSFDLRHGGNRQAIQSGVYYYSFNADSTAIPNERAQTVAAFQYIKTLAGKVAQRIPVVPLQSVVPQDTTGVGFSANPSIVPAVYATTERIINIIENGPSEVRVKQPINLSSAQDGNTIYAAKNIADNKEFIVAETIAYVNQFLDYKYDPATCARDVGYIVNSISFDLLYGGNRQSIQSGVYYWGYSDQSTSLPKERVASTLAYQYMKTLISNVITATPQSDLYQNTVTQIVGLPAATSIEVSSISNNIDTITTIINAGPSAVSTKSPIGLLPTDNQYVRNAVNLLEANRDFIRAEVIGYVESTQEANPQVFLPFYDKGANATLSVIRNYDIITNIIENGLAVAPIRSDGNGIFARAGMSNNDVKIAPVVTAVTNLGSNVYQVEISQSTIGYGDAHSLYFGQTAVFPLLDPAVPDRWQQRRINPIGSMGGALIDGGVISDRSPIQSFVFDAYTQLNQGGNGVFVTNNGYAQLVSVFTIFCSNAVTVENGGICSITNSNSNFGDICLTAKGYGKREFSGYVKNAPVLPYYPNGVYPQNGQVQIYIADPDLRPHIALVMEVTPPDGYINNQGLPGFLSGNTNVATLTTGTIDITGIDTTGFCIGQVFYVRDQYGRQVDTNNQPYVRSGTIIANVGYQSVSLNYPLNSGGGDPNNANYFNLYSCGNAYYTVLSSVLNADPITPGTLLLPNAQNLEETSSLEYLNSLSKKIVNNEPVATLTTATQVYDYSLVGGSSANAFIANSLDIIGSILTNGPDSSPTVTQTGTLPAGAGSAASLLKKNRAFLQEEIIAYVDQTFFSFNYNQVKCARDTGLIVDAIAQDLLFTTPSQTTFAALQYWNQAGYTGGIAQELTTTTNAINFVKGLSKEIVQGVVGTRYSTGTQVTNLTLATPAEAATIGTDFDVILNILNTGTAGVTDIIVPNSITSSTNINVVRAYNLLQANKEYIQQEAVAYVEATKPGFHYDQTKCRRDAGLIVEAIALDLAFPTANQSQATFSGLQYWNHGGYTGQIVSELTTTTAAINFVSDLAQRIIVNDASGTRYSAGTQVFGTAASAYEVAKVASEFEIITNILTTGTAHVTDIIVSNGINSSTVVTVRNAYDLLQANKSYIEGEAVAFVENTKTPGFVYNQTTCARDVGYMIDSISFDLLYGGNRQAVQSGVYYYDFSGTTAIPNEVTTTTNAFNYIKGLAQDIIQNNVITPRQTRIAQVRNSNTGTSVQVTAISNEIDLINTIITSGPGVVTTKEPISLTKSTNANALNASALLLINKDFIAAETIAYINQTYSFDYNQWTCYRDVGYMVDSVSIDLLYGGNRQAVQSGVYYYGFNENSTAIPNEISQTVDAYGHISSLTQKIILGQTVSALQSAVPQVTNLTAGTLSEVNSVKDLVSNVTNIIANGPNATLDRIPLPTTVSSDVVAINSAKMIETNRDFIVAEAISYISAEFPELAYNQTKCARDTGLLVDAIAQDVMFESSSQSTFAGIQYWNHDSYVGAIGAELTTTTNAINYVKSLAQKVVQNITTGTRYQSGILQVTTLPPATSAQASTIAADFTVITNILANGVAGVTDAIIPNSLTASADTNVQKAYALLQANKAYLEAEAIAYVEATKPASFVYDQTKCARDTGLIVDALVQDLLFSGTTQATFSGVQYWNHGSYVGAVGSELTTTTNAISYVKTLAKKAILNDLSGTRYQNTVQQNISGTPATTVEQTTINTEFDLILDIINNGVAGVTDRIVPNGLTASSTVAVQNAYARLQANKAYIQAEAVAYVENTKTVGFAYDQAKCLRDVGYMIDSVSFDLLYTGNLQAIESGVYYYSFNGSSTALPGEQTTTVDAYNYLKSILSNVITGVAIPSPYQTSVAQVTSGSHGTGSEVTAAQAEIDIITNIIVNGPGVANAAVPIGLTRSSDSNVINAATILHANRAFLKAEIIAYINSTTGGFQYDQAKCRRDVGFMVDSVSTDLLYGGNRQAIQSGVYYYGFNASSTALPGEQTQAIATYNYIRSILPHIVEGISVPAPYQGIVSQVTSGTVGNSVQARNAQAKMDIVTEIISNGPTVSGRKVPLGVTRSENENVVNAAKLIEANRAFIVAETIAYINGKYVSYNKDKCRRDVGLLVDALTYDLAKGGNYNAVIAGRSYYAEHGTHHIVQLEENVTDPALFPDGAITTFYQRSYMSASGYLFEYVGAGTNYGSLPQRGKRDPIQSKEVVQLNNGKVFFTSTDQNGDFRIGTGLVISQATGVLSGRTFTKSLFANLTPFILAIEG